MFADIAVSDAVLQVLGGSIPLPSASCLPFQ
jgi:hypothetical protein